MKNQMIKVALFAVHFVSTPLLATTVPWGTGMWGGMQACPYPYAAAPGSSDYRDEIEALRKEISQAESELRSLRRERDAVIRDLKRDRDTIYRTLDEDVAEFVVEHMDVGSACHEYKGLGDSKATLEIPKIIGVDRWAQYCKPDKAGRVDKNICKDSALKNSEKGSRREAGQGCGPAVDNYGKNVEKKVRLEARIERLQNDIKAARAAISDKATQAREEYYERMRERMEGGICWDCYTSAGAVSGGIVAERREPDWAAVATNVGLGLLSIYLGHQMNKDAMKTNAALGWPTQPYPAWGYGFPFLAAGIYGALGGGIGVGAYGCAAGFGGAGYWNGPW
ncbi:MAG: hypothetical protein N2578_08870, partial [Bdellovibrionaceae bacterium]|nr:hypothetical protein [Pseudobdellovibrionaceae bacterium]